MNDKAEKLAKYAILSTMEINLRRCAMDFKDMMEELEEGIVFAEKINDQELLEDLCSSYNKLNEAYLNIALTANKAEKYKLDFEKESISAN